MESLRKHYIFPIYSKKIIVTTSHLSLPEPQRGDMAEEERWWMLASACLDSNRALNRLPAL